MSRLSIAAHSAAGTGFLKYWPWISSQPLALSTRLRSVLSTPPAMILKFRLCASEITASAIVASSGSVSLSRMND